MLPDPFTSLNDGAAAIPARNFSLISLSPTSSVRKCTTGAAGEINTLKIAHSVVGKGAFARDRRLLRFEATGVVDGAEDPNYVGAIYVVTDFPQSTIFNAWQREAIFRQLIGTLRGNTTYAAGSIPVLSACWTRFQAGEV